MFFSGAIQRSLFMKTQCFCMGMCLSGTSWKTGQILPGSWRLQFKLHLPPFWLLTRLVLLLVRLSSCIQPQKANCYSWLDGLYRSVSRGELILQCLNENWGNKASGRLIILSLSLDSSKSLFSLLCLVCYLQQTRLSSPLQDLRAKRALKVLWTLLSSSLLLCKAGVPTFNFLTKGKKIKKK